jgi:hypothetical protein
LIVLNRFLSDDIPIPVSGSPWRCQRVVHHQRIAQQPGEQLAERLSDDFDLGFNYRPGDNITAGRVEVAVSTQASSTNGCC